MTDFPTEVCFLRSGTSAASLIHLSQVPRSGSIYMFEVSETKNKWQPNPDTLSLKLSH